MISYNIYCDESCHLENDRQKAMVLGAIWCPKEKRQGITSRIIEIKQKYKLSKDIEIKWNKISPSGFLFYKELVNYFFDNNDLHFRALIVPDKSVFRHKDFNQTHDQFYYKMYFDMLKIIIHPNASYNIYLDIKDTQGYKKIEKLKEVIRNSNYDFSKNIIRKIQEVKSDEVIILQLADLLIGSVSYINRDLKESKAKLEIINLIKKRSAYSLVNTTLPSERKFNLFKWQPGFQRNK